VVESQAAKANKTNMPIQRSRFMGAKIGKMLKQTLSCRSIGENRRCSKCRVREGLLAQVAKKSIEKAIFLPFLCKFWHFLIWQTL
jgi:7-cyano-7-deazaguanine synthase in queuosine biosynthesis